jgi:transcriptional repressor NrdR
MRCPFCGSIEDKVLDSREAPDGTSIRRRRECKACGRRFTTSEQIEQMDLFVVKRSGRRELFDRSKVLKGMRIACTGRPVSAEALDSAVSEIERMLHNRLEREVASEVIGDMVMERLRVMDQVAYVRFASVYRQFEDATQFRELVKHLQRRGGSLRDTGPTSRSSDTT